MGHRSELEDRYTVRCRAKGHESIDPNKHPAQKYLKGDCKQCAGEARLEKLSKIHKMTAEVTGGDEMEYVVLVSPYDGPGECDAFGIELPSWEVTIRGKSPFVPWVRTFVMYQKTIEEAMAAALESVPGY